MHEIKRGNPQHNMFKATILFIVGVFCCLIVGFVYVELFHKNVENIRIKEIIKEEEIEFKPVDCQYILFYTKHFSQHMPCVLRKSENKQLQKEYKRLIQVKEIEEKTQIQIDHITDILEFKKASIFDSDINRPTLVKENLILIQKSNESTIVLSPITSNLNVSIEDGESKYTSTDSFLTEKNKFLIQYVLKEGDLLYVPSYFFIQIKTKGFLYKFEYESSSRLLDNFFKVIYDDIITLN